VLTCSVCDAETSDRWIIGQASPGETYCSKACCQRAAGRRNDAKRSAAKRAVRGERACAHCEGLIPSERKANAAYCSKKCKKLAWEKRSYARSARHRERVRQKNRTAQALASRRDAHARRRAAIRAVTAERVDHAAVYARDAWICQLCADPVDRALRFPHPESPSLDHILPISAGGGHELANVQLAHLACNRRKGARVAA
jgi:hypothetical protein